MGIFHFFKKLIFGSDKESTNDSSSITLGLDELLTLIQENTSSDTQINHAQNQSRSASEIPTIIFSTRCPRKSDPAMMFMPRSKHVKSLTIFSLNS